MVHYNQHKATPCQNLHPSVYLYYQHPLSHQKKGVTSVPIVTNVPSVPSTNILSLYPTKKRVTSVTSVTDILYVPYTPSKKDVTSVTSVPCIPSTTNILFLCSIKKGCHKCLNHYNVPSAPTIDHNFRHKCHIHHNQLICPLYNLSPHPSVITLKAK